MPDITIACFNIEKNGQRSTLEKQTKVSDFVHAILHDFGFDIVFLCEVHSAREDDYIHYLEGSYGHKYVIDTSPGGYSNAYVLITRKALNLKYSFQTLKNLTRSILVCHVPNGPLIGLAHFKSGQTDLTENQISNAAIGLQDLGGQTGLWAIAGDMNWDYSRVNELDLPTASRAVTCWPDMTQRSGGILDWCLVGSDVVANAVDGPTFFRTEFQTMDGPDHRPVLFTLSY